jgi:hypothetical protein
MTKKPANINQSKTSTTVITFIRGEILSKSLFPSGFGACVPISGFGVSVAVDVLIGAGNTRVITGRGIKVVVGVIEGVTVGVYVSDGVIEVPVGVCVYEPPVGVIVVRSKTESVIGLGTITKSTQIISI